VEILDGKLRSVTSFCRAMQEFTNAESILEIGKATGKAMLALLKNTERTE
jgi:hypothetical protein